MTSLHHVSLPLCEGATMKSVFVPHELNERTCTQILFAIEKDA